MRRRGRLRVTARSPPKMKSLWGVALPAGVLLVVAALPGCSDIALPTTSPPAAGPNPTYGKLIADNLKTFKNVLPNSPVALASPQWVQSMKGPVWLVCVHFQEQEHLRTYAYFVNGAEIVDSRYAVETDACDKPTYSSSLDLGSGVISPRAPGAQGQLY